MGWQFQYWNGSAWLNFSGAYLNDHVLEELSSVGGQEEVLFSMPNTAANRSIVLGKPQAQALFNGNVAYSGVLFAVDFTPALLTCYIYNPVFVALEQATSVMGNPTQTYSGGAANTILAAICACVPNNAVTVGSCPTTPVTITFTNAQPMDAVKDLAEKLGLVYWGANGQINIGTRDSTVHTPSVFEHTSKRSCDWSKQVGTVIVKGALQSSGAAIQGQYPATTTGSVRVFNDSQAGDVPTLTALAQYKWNLLNNPSNGNPLVFLTSDAAAWHPGQYVNVTRPDLNFVGSFMIMRITKQAVLCTVEVDMAVPSDAATLQDVTDDGTDQGDTAVTASQVVGSLPTSQLSGSLAGFGTMDMGTDAAKPAAGVPGRIYWAVDTNKIYLDTGSSWQFIGSSVLGNLTGTISTGVLTGSLAGFATMSQGADASKPSAGIPGRIYYATDTNKTYLDTGSGWILTGTPFRWAT